MTSIRIFQSKVIVLPPDGEKTIGRVVARKYNHRSCFVIFLLGLVVYPGFLSGAGPMTSGGIPGIVVLGISACAGYLYLRSFGWVTKYLIRRMIVGVIAAYELFLMFHDIWIETRLGWS